MGYDEDENVNGTQNTGSEMGATETNFRKKNPTTVRRHVPEKRINESLTGRKRRTKKEKTKDPRCRGGKGDTKSRRKNDREIGKPLKPAIYSLTNIESGGGNHTGYRRRGLRREKMDCRSSMKRHKVWGGGR